MDHHLPQFDCYINTDMKDCGVLVYSSYINSDMHYKADTIHIRLSM